MPTQKPEDSAIFKLGELTAQVKTLTTSVGNMETKLEGTVTRIFTKLDAQDAGLRELVSAEVGKVSTHPTPCQELRDLQGVVQAGQTEIRSVWNTIATVGPTVGTILALLISAMAMWGAWKAEARGQANAEPRHSVVEQR